MEFDSESESRRPNHDRVPVQWQPLWLAEKRRRLANTWELYGAKSQRIVRLQGDLRYYCWLLLEGDSDVVAICEEPFPVSGQALASWPRMDFWCRRQNGTELYLDVYYYSRLTLDRNCERIQLEVARKTAWALERSAAYAITTDKLITRIPLLLANWSVVLRHLALQRRGSELPELSESIRRAIATLGSQTMGELQCRFDVEPTTLQTALYRELHAGTVTADLSSQLLGAQTQFFLQTRAVVGAVR